MGFTTDPSLRTELLCAINRMNWTTAPGRPPYFTSSALAAVVNAVVDHQRPLGFVGIAQLRSGRRLIGLHDSGGTRSYVLDLDSEAIHLLTELTPQRPAIPRSSDAA
jgi:hypothetical protein